MIVSRDKRSVGAQIKSGFVIAGELVGGFVVFILAAKGLQGLVVAAPISHFAGPPIAWLELAIAAIVMFATAERWGGFIPGFFFLSGAIKATSASVFPVIGVTRSEAALVAIYSIAIIALLWRFLPPRRWRATLVDRAALTTFALSVAATLVAPSTTAALRVVLVGSIPLLVAWTAYRWKIRKHGTKNRRRHPGRTGIEQSKTDEVSGPIR